MVCSTRSSGCRERRRAFAPRGRGGFSLGLRCPPPMIEGLVVTGRRLRRSDDVGGRSRSPSQRPEARESRPQPSLEPRGRSLPVPFREPPRAPSVDPPRMRAKSTHRHGQPRSHRPRPPFLARTRPRRQFAAPPQRHPASAGSRGWDRRPPDPCAATAARWHRREAGSGEKRGQPLTVDMMVRAIRLSKLSRALQDSICQLSRADPAHGPKEIQRAARRRSHGLTQTDTKDPHGSRSRSNMSKALRRHSSSKASGSVPVASTFRPWRSTPVTL